MSDRGIVADSLGVAVPTGAYGISFGAIGVASGLDVLQTCLLSLLVFTGASQFAFIGVVASGGNPFAGALTALLLGTRNLLEQRDTAVTELRKIPGVSVVPPRGALYAFPRLDPEVYPVKDDQQLALDLLMKEKILITPGTGFNWPDPDHLRIVTLPWARDLAEAIQRLGSFLSSYEQA